MHPVIPWLNRKWISHPKQRVEDDLWLKTLLTQIPEMLGDIKDIPDLVKCPVIQVPDPTIHELNRNQLTNRKLNQEAKIDLEPSRHWSCILGPVIARSPVINSAFYDFYAK
ncbi:hypothetical protein VNO77_04361 [Canavalia gladiata]|uniref:Uncharacterized protein n=1 Tax=Canavalia gladiata TaxID=3824 RepID=A0AAN9MX75_CANGL